MPPIPRNVPNTRGPGNPHGFTTFPQQQPPAGPLTDTEADAVALADAVSFDLQLAQADAVTAADSVDLADDVQSLLDLSPPEPSPPAPSPGGGMWRPIQPRPLHTLTATVRDRVSLTDALAAVELDESVRLAEEELVLLLI